MWMFAKKIPKTKNKKDENRPKKARNLKRLDIIGKLSKNRINTPITGTSRSTFIFV